jgi:hypothetical protein
LVLTAIGVAALLLLRFWVRIQERCVDLGPQAG